jgi:hypothetical protein
MTRIRLWIGRHQFDIAFVTLLSGIGFLLTQAVLAGTWGGICTTGVIRHPIRERIVLGLAMQSAITAGCFVIFGIGRVLMKLLDRQIKAESQDIYDPPFGRP